MEHISFRHAEEGVQQVSIPLKGGGGLKVLPCLKGIGAQTDLDT